MELKITISLSPEDRDALAKIADAISSVKGDVKVETSKPEKKSKKGKSETAPSADDELSIEDDLGGGGDATDELGGDDALEGDSEEETFEDDEPAKITPEQLANVKKALNAYANKNGKKKAVAILKKFAEVSQDVKSDDYVKIMKALKA